jgi:hypothetical protein
METTMKRHNASCAPVPDFTRLQYFYGQVLSAQDFQKEQDYFREKLKLHNRCLHGYGVVCGLKINPEPIDPTCESDNDRKRVEVERQLALVREEIKAASDTGAKQSAKAKKTKPGKNTASETLDQMRARAEKLERELEELEKLCDAEEKRTRIEVECGMALDCEGNELIVRRPLTIDLLDALRQRPDQQAKYEWPRTLYVSICFCEQPVDPVRPVMPDSCGTSTACTYGKVRDSVQIKVSVDPPARDERCETCCETCADHCVLLARIYNFRPGRPLSHDQIHNAARRPVSLYEPATITGISWTQGAHYSSGAAEDLLNHMEVRFSRDVLISSITDGVVDMWVIEGGKTRHSGIYSLEVEYKLPPGPARTTDRLKFRYAGDENLDPGDRVLVTIRGGFILDECCRPVNGMNTGGRTPLIPGEEFSRFKRPSHFQGCISPPPGFGPWHSGAGSPGGANFESWFYIANDDHDNRSRDRHRGDDDRNRDYRNSQNREAS